MKPKIQLSDPFWWFWAITLVFIVTAVAGWTPGYYLVMAVSAFQVLVFLVRERNAMVLKHMPWNRDRAGRLS